MPTVNAGNRICQPITQANCRRDSRTGSRSMVDLLSPPATRRTNARHPCARGYSDAATEASPRIRNSLSLARAAHDLDRPFHQARRIALAILGKLNDQLGDRNRRWILLSMTTLPTRPLQPLLSFR